MLLVTALLLFQAGTSAQPAQTARADGRPVDNFSIYAGDGVQAPTQPDGRRSNARVVTTPRVGTKSPARLTGPIRVRVGDLTRVRGQEENVVQGVGLVTGLAGTGDSSNAARQSLLNILRTQNINLNLQDINSANIAVVLIQATLPAGIKPGSKIDVRVSSIYDCESLVGATLIAAELTDMTGQTVFVTASGPVTTGGFSAEGDGATVVRNHLTVGTIPNGGKVQREVSTEIVNEHGFIYLDMMALKGSFENSLRITEAINLLYPSMAVAQDAMTISVRVPSDVSATEHVAYLTSILAREIVPATNARIVINERTGVIVMGEGVRITPGAITNGNLTVTISESPEASQPGPFSSGQTQNLPRTSLLVEEEDNPLTIVNGAVTLEEVVEILNLLGATPRDMIQILQSMAQQGMLHAEILVL